MVLELKTSARDGTHPEKPDVQLTLFNIVHKHVVGIVLDAVIGLLGRLASVGGRSRGAAPRPGVYREPSPAKQHNQNDIAHRQ